VGDRARRRLLERLLVDATPINQGRTQQLWMVDITTEEGRIVAHGEVRLQNIEPR
jgi:acyl-coenzyme A thioesterase PaaI-like protein